MFSPKKGEMSEMINVLIKLNGDNPSKKQLAGSYTCCMVKIKILYSNYPTIKKNLRHNWIEKNK